MEVICQSPKHPSCPFQKKGGRKSKFVFKCGSKQINVVDQYKYFRCVLNEHLDFTIISNVVVDAASTVGGIINNCLNLNSIMYNTYKKVYNTGVVPIMDYDFGVWGYKCYDKPQVAQNRAQRAFLGVHQYASNVVVNGNLE